MTSPYIVGEYLVLTDIKGYSELIHIVNKNSFEHLAATGTKGQGPDEISNMGRLAISEKEKKIYVSDFGKYQVTSYSVEELLANPLYSPEVKATISKELFMSGGYLYFNDTLCIGRVIEPTSNSTFNQKGAKWNMKTGEIKSMPYSHGGIERKRISVGASEEYNRYVEVYTHEDLITICDFEGNLLYNIYGPGWKESQGNKMIYYKNVVFCQERLLVLHSGAENFGPQEDPQEILVFDLDGNYIKTLNVGLKIYEFCYDKENNRLIFSLNDEPQFAYLDLGKLLG